KNEMQRMSVMKYKRDCPPQLRVTDRLIDREIPEPRERRHAELVDICGRNLIDRFRVIRAHGPLERALQHTVEDKSANVDQHQPGCDGEKREGTESPAWRVAVIVTVVDAHGVRIVGSVV